MTYADTVAEVKRVSTKDDVIEKYLGGTPYDWDGLPDTVQDVVADMYYRGEWGPVRRSKVVPLLAGFHDDPQALYDYVGAGEGTWDNLNSTRQKARLAHMQQAVEDAKKAKGGSS